MNEIKTYPIEYLDLTTLSRETRRLLAMPVVNRKLCEPYWHRRIKNIEPCKCGEKSVIKGMCWKCYGKQYYNKARIAREGIIDG